MLSALFSSTLQRVLGLVYGQPDRRFFATEIIQLAGSGSGAVQRELARLTETGLILQEKVGKQKFYRANKEAPIFSELQQIVRKTVGLVEPLRQALQPLGNKIKIALVYGSVAKGGETATSDIDLLVVSDHLSLHDLYDVLTDIESHLGRRISITLYKKDEFIERVRKKNPFLIKVLAGEYIKIVGEESWFDEAGVSRKA